ncbi:MAG: hypothetical protein B7Y40_02565 [Gammaproteobacteria bacterium 28-57-27]|nr:MAG: hypothetical protein B7Y40_02565 [Gammaproteobacteria bacterium 28-57-27]
MDLVFSALSPRGESSARGAKPLGRGGYGLDSACVTTLSPTLPRQGGGGETAFSEIVNRLLNH